MGWEAIFLWIVSLIILYVVVSAAVKDGIDKSEVGRLIKTRNGTKNIIIPVGDDEIEKELEDEFNNRNDK